MVNASQKSMQNHNCPGMIVPLFTEDNLSGWFQGMEEYLKIAGINRDLWFSYVVTSLPKEILKDVNDFLGRPKGEKSYELLKSTLIKTRRAIVLQKTLQESIQSRKPSQFLQHLRDLALSEIPDRFLGTLWFNELPNNLQKLLASHHSQPLDVKAKIADNIVDALRSNGCDQFMEDSCDLIDTKGREYVLEYGHNI